MSNKLLNAALDYADLGWFVFPCKPDKAPHFDETDLKHGKDNATTDQAKIRSWWARWPDALIGVYCEGSNFFAIDVDNKSGKNGSRSWAELVENHAQGANIEAGPTQTTPSGGWHILFNLPDDVKIPNNADKLGPGLDLRSNGYIILTPSAGYEWISDHGPDQPITDAPGWLLAEIENLSKKRPPQNPLKPLQPVAADDAGEYWLKHYLGITTIGNRNNNGFELACQLRDSGLAENEGSFIMQSFASLAPGGDYTETEALAAMRSAYSQAPREPANLPGVNQAPNAPRTHQDAPGAPLDAERILDAITPQIPTQGALTDTANADRLVFHYGDLLRWVEEWGWLIWNGASWTLDKKSERILYAKQTARKIYLEASKQDEESAPKYAKFAASSLNRTRLNAMLELAESELPKRPEDFDVDPMLLNVQNGIVDLRTGELKEHDRQLFLRKIAGTSYDPGTRSPAWDSFLVKILPEQEMRDFIQRCVGYSLTGDVTEQCLFFLYGSGANGKSTFISAVMAMLGDYARQSAPQLLLKGNRHPTELADLQGARLVATVEIEEGAQMAEVMTKQLTGGDKIKARMMHQDFYEFDPTHKIWFAANHQPEITGTDLAIWRRIHLIEYDVTIRQEEQDPRMLAKLLQELPGILAWAMRGLKEWQEGGLQVPDKVKVATAVYKQDMDIIGGFLDDCVRFDKMLSKTAGEIYKAYEEWAVLNGEEKISSRAFSKRMRERGHVTKGRDHLGRALYPGIGLRQNDAESIP